jgi:Uma2 family endonuclease
MGALPQLALREQQHVLPKMHLWTVDEYMQMAKAGIFDNLRVELIEGDIFEMCSQDYSHFYSHDKTTQVLREAFGKGYWVRNQAQLNLRPNSAPEPDVSIVKGSRDDYDDHPTTAVLVVEVSNTTLIYDLYRKAAIYAAAGIEDYWVINLPDWRIDVLRKPCKEFDGSFKYSSIQPFHIGEFISPLARPEINIAVADLMPPEKLIRKES